MRTLVLPGLHGSGRLLARFAQALPAPIAPEIIAYPDRAIGYDALADGVPVGDAPCAIVAESFSGPIGVRLASRPNVRALVLVATFTRAPALALPGALLGSLLFRAPPPRTFLRHMLLDRHASDDEIAELARAIREVKPSTLAARVEAVARVDVRAELAALRVPVLVISGTRDRLVPRAARLARALPHAEHLAIDAPHLVLQRRPEEAARAIGAFVSRYFGK